MNYIAEEIEKMDSETIEKYNEMKNLLEKLTDPGEGNYFIMLYVLSFIIKLVGLSTAFKMIGHTFEIIEDHIQKEVRN